MNTATDLLLIGTLAGVWLSAGLLADGLPAARTARELRRRARTVSLLVGGGTVVLLAAWLVPGTSTAATAALLPAVPALVVLLLTARRLTQIRRGASAFATAPLTPAPPALRAAAAHPMVATPLQITGLAAIAALPIAAGLIEVPGAQVAGILLTVLGLAVLALGIRHAIRHSRLNLRVLAPLGKVRLHPLPARQISAEAYTALPIESGPAESLAGPAHRAA